MVAELDVVLTETEVTTGTGVGFGLTTWANAVTELDAGELAEFPFALVATALKV